MPARNEDLHGSAPDKSDMALLIVDVINDLDFPEANQLMRYAPAMARKIAQLKERAKKARIPVIYVNDNFGRWQSDFRRLVEHCRQGKAREIIDLLRPDDDDYFVLKPKHSGFFFFNSRNVAALSGDEDTCPYWHRRKLLRPLHRE